MAAVLFISWQFMGSGRSGEGSVTQTAPPVAPAEEIAVDVTPDTSELVQQPSDSLEITQEQTDSSSVESVPEDRTITLIIEEQGDSKVISQLSSRRGSIIGWSLSDYQDMPPEGQGRVDFDGTAWSSFPGYFTTEAPDTIRVSDDAEEIVFRQHDGGGWVKYTFYPSSYIFEVETEGLGDIFVLSGGILPVSENNADPSRYFSAQWNSEKVKKRDSRDLEIDDQVGNVEWIAARSKYFAVIVFPRSFQRAYGYTYATAENESPSVGIQDSSVLIYAGPLDYGVLREIGLDTHLMVDFGWPVIRDIGRLLFWFCTSVISFAGNWGFKIILLSIALKVVLLPLTQKSFRSMAMLKKVQPKMKAIQEKYKSDPKALQAAMQKLYREEGVNPLGGCLPLLLQMPVFFALYRVLANSVQLRGAPFMLWIQDLSSPEILIRFGSPILGLHGVGLLAVLMGLAMFLQQKMTMTDQSQKGMMYIMPIFMTFLFMRFPAGLTLYWFMNNILTIVQQRMIQSKLESETV